MLYYFKKGKNTTEMQRFVEYMKKVLTDQMHQKCFVKFLGAVDILAK